VPALAPRPRRVKKSPPKFKTLELMGDDRAGTGDQVEHELERHYRNGWKLMSCNWDVDAMVCVLVFGKGDGV